MIRNKEPGPTDRETRELINLLEKELTLSRAFFDAVDSPLLLIDGIGRVLMANIHARKAYGFSPEDVGSMIIWERIPSSMAEEWQNEIAKVIRQKKARQFRFEKGNQVSNLSIWPVRDPQGRIRSFALFEKDLTEKIRALENIELFKSQGECTDAQISHASKLISLGTLVSGIAHEISNPNAFILTNAPLLSKIWEELMDQMKENLNDKEIRAGGLDHEDLAVMIPDLLKGINEGALRINKIVKSLKAFVRPENQEAFQPVCLNDIVRTCLLFLKNDISKATHHFSTNLNHDLPDVAGIPQRLEQLVLNLVQNACQSLDSRKRKVRVTTQAREGQVILMVEDEGCGIPKENINKILTPFFTTKTDTRGTGLGLAIGEKIVRDHNGRMTFEPRKGRGTLVTITFPELSR